MEHLTITQILLIAFFFRLGMYLAEFFLNLVIVCLTNMLPKKDE